MLAGTQNHTSDGLNLLDLSEVNCDSGFRQRSGSSRDMMSECSDTSSRKDVTGLGSLSINTVGF